MEDDAGRLVQVGAQQLVAAARDVAAVVLLAGLVAPRRQADVGPDAGRLGEALRRIYDADVGERDQDADPGAVINRRTASSCRATATSRRPSTAICSPMACQAASSAPATSCSGPPATSARTRSAKGRPPPLPAIRPKGLRTPRIWLARSTRIRTSCAQVMSRERTRWLSTLLTTTSRYQPVRTICARPRASLRSDLFSCRASAALTCRA